MFDICLLNLRHWSILILRTLIHWGRVTHICVGNLTIIGSDNGLSPGWCQLIIWTNAGILLIGPRGTNFSEILIGIQTFSSKKMHLKMASAKWRPYCLGHNELMLLAGPISILSITSDRSVSFSSLEDINIMMTSSNGNIYRVTDPLCGEFTGHRWIRRTKASDAELWCILSSAPE